MVEDTAVFSTIIPSVGIYSAQPNNLSITLGGNKCLVTIKSDGVIEYGEGYTPDAAAKAFWDALGYRRALMEAAPDMLAALQAITADILAYEQINNLVPNPGRKYCWDSVERGMDVIAKATGTPTT